MNSCEFLELVIVGETKIKDGNLFVYPTAKQKFKCLKILEDYKTTPEPALSNEDPELWNLITYDFIVAFEEFYI